ncbi:MAG: hypothetical protein ACFFKA_11765, partial [Candidatus Thorarchaeota archaeon]
YIIGIIGIIGFLTLFSIALVGFNYPEPEILTLNNAWKINDVSIDGGFTNNTEWLDASKVQLNDVSIFYFKNDNESIFLCLDAIGDTTLDDGDFFRIHFDTDNDNIWSAGKEDSFAYYSGMFSGGTHYIINVTGNPHEYITHCVFSDPGLEGDTNYSTSPNSVQNHQIYEMQISLSILGVIEGDTIGFFIYGGPFNAIGPSYTTFPKNANPLDMNTWAELKIGDSNQSSVDYTHLNLENLFMILMIISIIGICSIILLLIFFRFIRKKNVNS